MSTIIQKLFSQNNLPSYTSAVLELSNPEVTTEDIGKAVAIFFAKTHRFRDLKGESYAIAKVMTQAFIKRMTVDEAVSIIFYGQELIDESESGAYALHCIKVFREIFNAALSKATKKSEFLLLVKVFQKANRPGGGEERKHDLLDKAYDFLEIHEHQELFREYLKTRK